MNYTTLFEMRIRHDYFLNKGTTLFFQMNAAEQQEQLLNYDLNRFLEIIPTDATRLLLKNQRMFFRVSQDCLRVGVETTEGDSSEPVIAIAESASLNFIIRLKDPHFPYYTNLDFGNNAFILLTNEAPATQPALPLVKRVPQSDVMEYITDTSFMNQATTAAYTADIPQETLIGTVGFISVKMKTTDSNYTIIDTPVKIHTNGRSFYAFVQNTSHFWKYKKSSDASVFRSSTKLPLVQNGFIELDPGTALVPPQTLVEGMKVPNPTVFNFEEMDINGTPELCSVIYI